MSKKFYYFIIYFLGLMVVTVLLNSIIQFQLGNKVIKLPSFLGWSLVINLISLATSLLIINYYLHKKYWFTFVAGIFSVLTNIFSLIIFYKVFSSGQLTNYYLPSLIIAASFATIYGISLIFSVAKQRFWLRLTGIFISMLSVLLVVILIKLVNSQEIQIHAKLEKIIQWISLTTSLIPALFIMNFLDELKESKSQFPNVSIQKYSKNVFLILGSITFLLTFIFVGIIIIETSSSVIWRKHTYKLALELDKKFEKRAFVGSKGDTLLYRFMKPLEYNPEKKFPLIVGLHHGGLHGNDNIIQLTSSLVPLLSSESNRGKYLTFLFVPQSPEGKGFGRAPNSHSIDSLVFEAIIDFEKEFNIDKTRRYVIGASGGGYGTWNFISSRPEMFAAAIPISGGGNPKFASNLTNVAIWAFHGAKDKDVPVNLSRDMIEAIKKAGGNPKYTEYPNKGHIIGNEVENTQGLLDWLFEQKRED